MTKRRHGARGPVQAPAGLRTMGGWYKFDCVPDKQKNRDLLAEAHANNKHVKRTRELPETVPETRAACPALRRRHELAVGPAQARDAARRRAPPPSLDPRPAAPRRRGPAAPGRRTRPLSPAPAAPPKRRRSARRESIETSDAPPPRRRARPDDGRAPRHGLRGGRRRRRARRSSKRGRSRSRATGRAAGRAAAATARA